MNIKSILLFSGIFLLKILNLSAQDLKCGTVVTSDDLVLLQQLKSTQLKSTTPASEIRYFPIQHHIVRTSNATGGLSSSVPQQLIEELNEAFEGANIKFYTCNAIDYINSDNYYDFSSSEESSLMSTYNNPDAINVYYFNTVSVLGQQVAGYSYIPIYNINFIAIRNSYAIGPVVIHEFGHFFGLLETHEPTNAKEFVDSSNCSIAGDLICDTPADPELSTTNVNSSCVYIGTEVDPHGDPYNPDTRNYMSYSRNACVDKFSNGQMGEMSYWADQTERQTLTNTRILNFPINRSFTFDEDVIILYNATISNCDLILDACESVIIDYNFEVILGATLEIK